MSDQGKERPGELAFRYDEELYNILSAEYIQFYDTYCGIDSDFTAMSSFMLDEITSGIHTKEKRIELENQIVAKYISEVGGNPDQTLEEVRKDAILICLIAFADRDQGSERLLVDGYMVTKDLKYLNALIELLKPGEVLGRELSGRESLLLKGYENILKIIEANLE
jgi:hypothetical protein